MPRRLAEVSANERGGISLPAKGDRNPAYMPLGKEGEARAVEERDFSETAASRDCRIER